MLYRFAFGDYWGDGHKEFEEVWISCPDKRFINDAIVSIKQKYGEHFFNDFAADYERPYISDTVCQALEDANYPLVQVFLKSDCWPETYPYITSIRDIAKESGNDFCLYIDAVIDMFIHLLNYHGAHITVLQDAPFEVITTDVGYGCFS